MRWVLILAWCMVSGACTLRTAWDDPPLVAAPPADAALTGTPALTVADLMPPPVPTTCVQLVQLPSLAEERALTSKKARLVMVGDTRAPEIPKPAPERSPVAIVTQAQQDALVQPTTTTYFGRTAEARYTWQPGQIYTVLLAPEQQTIITLPVHEVLLIGLALRDEEFLVVNKKVGKDETGRYVVSITPQPTAKGTYQTALITDTGHQYRLKLIVGTVAMIGITFEVPVIYQEEK